MRKTSLLSLLSNFFTMVRRLILLYIAMFLEEHSWLQVSVFTLLSLASLVYLGYTRPFKTRQQNRLNIFNEWCSLVIAYHVMVLNGMSHQVETFQDTGTLITNLLYFNWGVNALIILTMVCKEAKFTVLKINRWCKVRKIKK